MDFVIGGKDVVHLPYVSSSFVFLVCFVHIVKEFNVSVGEALGNVWSYVFL